ncbi:hypothetical protein ACFRQM_04320 [Streptomyces sp. NPDC056831]|uniref:hypothetical protein n=1 Tax=Streptomyces sp. NPDC056831 TaxID=3345954 RepID=UPI0036AD46B2
MPKLAAILATLAAVITQLIGITVMLTTRAIGDPGTATATGLALTTLGFLATLAAAPPACRALYIWARDRGYLLYHQHQAQDAALPASPVVHLPRSGTMP